MYNREFFDALDQIVRERKLDKELLINSIEEGLASACRKEFGADHKVKAKLHEETGEINFFAYQIVVEGEPEENYEISLEEAKEVRPDAKVGDFIGEDIEIGKLSRIASQTAMNVIKQKINEAIKDQVSTEIKQKDGELVSAIVRKVDPSVTFVEITNSQLEGRLADRDQIRGEVLKPGDVIKVLVKSVRDNKNSTQVNVSRSVGGFVKKLFEMEVPEMRVGLVKVKSIVREAGVRTKMAVYTDDPNIDPATTCIGPRGERVNNVIRELNGEKVDIINYTPNIKEMIVRSLSPLRSVIDLKVDEEQGKATVIVADDKLSLAIGKGGSNAKLAAKLCDIKLDIKPYSALMEETQGEANE